MFERLMTWLFDGRHVKRANKVQEIDRNIKKYHRRETERLLKDFLNGR